MIERRGWLLDLYADEQDGLVFWLLGEDGCRHRLRQSFPITFYVAGPSPRLRALWRYLQNHPIPLELDRVSRHDLFSGFIDVMAVRVESPACQPRLFQALNRRFRRMCLPWRQR